MFRKLLLVLLVVVGLAVIAFAVLLVITPAAPIAEQPPSKPAVERRKAALQADAEGQYVPGYHFVVGPLRFTGFSLRPEALVRRRWPAVSRRPSPRSASGCAVNPPRWAP